MNWKYTSGTVLPYNQGTVQVTADDVRPSGFVYVATWGNDTTGNGSRALPFRSIAKAITVNTNVIIGTGFYNETGNFVRLIADGDVIMDGTNMALQLSSNQAHYVDLTLQNWTNLTSASYSNFYGCTLSNVGTSGTTINIANFTNCIAVNCNATIIVPATVSPVNGTFINCREIRITQANTASNTNVYYRCNILLGITGSLKFCLFHECNFRINTSVGTQPAAIFPATPSGYTYYSDFNTLHAAVNSYYGTSDYLQGGRIADPRFNSLSKNDFTLQGDSPARNMAFNGKFVGARGFALALNPENAEYLENITITNGVATLANNQLQGVLRWPVTDLGAEYEASSPYINGLAAYRNGESFNVTADLASTAISAGQSLTTNQSYVVETGTINYNGQMYNIGARFTAVSAATTFTTSEGGVLRQVILRPTRQVIKLKTHRSAFDTGTFAGLSWHLYEAGQKITANRVGDLGTGAIIRGNGATDFDRTPSKVLPVYFRGLQVEIIIQPKGLRSI